jgi:ubiquinone/menaquinone biosynthesis C-methylase UbiE
MTRTARSILMRMFGRPAGLMGRLGGVIMARSNRPCAEWVVDELDVRRGDAILEIGFGPGVAIALLAERTPDGRVAGVDPSAAMVSQARARNRHAAEQGRVDLRTGTAERLPFAAGEFDKALAINSMQLWPDAPAGLREVWRVLKPGGTLALAFTPYSGQSRSGLTELVAAAGFSAPEVRERDGNVQVRAIKPVGIKP